MGKIADSKDIKPVATVLEQDNNIVLRPGITLHRGIALYTSKQLIEAKRGNLGIEAIHTQINYLQSEVLTIVEASFSDPLQRQAVIKLVKASFNKRHNWLDEIVYGSSRDDSSKGYDAHPQAVINGEAKETQE